MTRNATWIMREYSGRVIAGVSRTMNDLWYAQKKNIRSPNTVQPGEGGWKVGER